MARGNFPSSKQDQFVLRFPDGMRNRIKAAADANGRSMNSEIIATLDEKYPERSFNVEALDEVLGHLMPSLLPTGDPSAVSAVNERLKANGSPFEVRIDNEGQITFRQLMMTAGKK